MSATTQRSHRASSSRSSSRSTLWGALTPGGRWLVGAIIGVAAVLALSVGADSIASAGRIHPGVRVGDVAVGAMAPKDAQAKIASAFAEESRRPVTLTWGSRSWRVSASDVDAHIDTWTSVQRAMQVGRGSGFGSQVLERVSALFGGVTVPAKVNARQSRLDLVVSKVETAVALPARDASVAVDGTGVRFIHAVTGRAVVRQSTVSALLSAFLSSNRTVPVTVGPALVSVSDTDARQAYLDAQRLVAGPVTIVFKGTVHAVARSQVVSWVGIRADPIATGPVGPSATASAATTSQDSSASVTRRSVLRAYFEPTRIATSLGSLLSGVGRPSTDATFVASGGTVRIKPSQVGIGADLPGLATDLAQACTTGRKRMATLRLTALEPKLSTEQAAAMGITERIGTFTTDYDSGNRPRVNNVHLLAASLNNQVVAPGAVFSFNQAAGERTAAKGYQEAPAIVDGKLVPQLGGGVCQVGTTMFNAIFFSGLPVVERTNHSFFISHYPRGRDATVSWDGPDLKFRNDTSSWVLIRTSFTDSSLTVSLYGTTPDYRVEYTTSPLTNVVPFPVTQVRDPTLPVGAKVVSDPGVNGCTITVVRTVYQGGRVVRTDTFVSHYKAKVETVRVGTKPVSKPATATVTPKK
jgi:vancomycin resistance protein YoaR